MDPTRPQRVSRVLALDQRQYKILPVRDTRVVVGGQATNLMETFWVPSPEEIEAIVRGEPICLGVLGTVHPPVRVTVGEKED